jgi:spermidine synthase
MPEFGQIKKLSQAQALGLLLISEACVAKQEKKMQDLQPQYAPVTFSEEHGVRFLHFGTWWVQGAMRINRPDEIELEYAQQMMAGLLFLDPNDSRLNGKGSKFQMLQLGLGTGALTKFAHKHFKNAFVRAIELNPAVIVAAHVMFGLPHRNKNLDIVETDAMKFVTSRKNKQSADFLQVDLYDATARGPVLSSRDFYQGCFDVLKEVGVMTVNLFGNHKSFKSNIENICDVFQNRVLVFPEVHDCNVIVIAFKGPKIDLKWPTLASRAQELEKCYGLPAKLWPKKLREANWGQEQKLVI